MNRPIERIKDEIEMSLNVIAARQEATEVILKLLLRNLVGSSQDPRLTLNSLRQQVDRVLSTEDGSDVDPQLAERQRRLREMHTLQILDEVSVSLSLPLIRTGSPS